MVLPLDDDRLADTFVRALVPDARTASSTTHRVVTERRRRRRAGRDVTPLARVQWFERLEADFDAVVFVAHATPDAWTRACLDRADVVLTVAAAARARRSARSRSCSSVPDSRPAPSWCSCTTRRPRSRAHTRAGSRRGRFAATTTSATATTPTRHASLVSCSTAGSASCSAAAARRGIAHIGVLRALEAHGVPIDATGGTSIGSIIAGAVARGYDADRTATLLRAAVVEGRSPVDVTLPVLSIAAGARVTERIQDGADGLDLEDAWRNTFCVSTNLTTGLAEIHRDGPGGRRSAPASLSPACSPRCRTTGARCSSTAACSTTCRSCPCATPTPASP